MPSAPDVNLEEIKNKAHDIILENKGKNPMFAEEPIAFGLKAVIASFEQNENHGELEPIEQSLRKIKNVNSAEVIDMRRAFG